MMKSVSIAIWSVLVALLTGYFGALLAQNAQKPDPETVESKALQLETAPAMNVPLISGNKVIGYQVVRLSYARIENKNEKIPIPLDVIVLDEAFAVLYANLDYLKEKKSDWDMAAFRKELLQRINRRVGGDAVKDIFVQEFNFVEIGLIRN